VSEETIRLPFGEITPVVEACVAVLSQTPSALVTDIDGTISAIAATPFEAVVDRVAVQALERLVGRLAAVAVVSGRAPDAGAELVEELELRGIVFFGDDVTDVDGFRALRALREELPVLTLNVAVLGPETPEVVAQAADLAVEGVPACAATLADIAALLDVEEMTEGAAEAHTLHNGTPGVARGGSDQGEIG
jgi:trehalose-6-phosphatase